MRIACIHIPQYALQCATRVDPSLRGSAAGAGAAIAMVNVQGASPRIGAAGTGSSDPEPRFGAGPLHAPVVVACSRAAWALGVRLGMTATAARVLAADISVVPVDAAVEREAVRAIADALLALTPVVDVGGRVGAGGAHLAMYAEVPQKVRGQSFGERALERLAELGLTGRIGIADDRFTAWVAAAYGAEAPRHSTEARAQDHGVVTMVPRGGSAAFLAPRPLSLLAISPEVQHMLEALGVRTLGEFAALPAPSVARPLEADYRALARGESGSHLRPYAPEAAIREELVVSAGNVLDAAGAVSGPTAIALVAKRLALRLEGRGRGAARVELFTATERGSRTITPDLAAVAEVGLAAAAAQADLPGHIEPRATPAITSAEQLARAFAPILEAAGEATTWRLRATVVGEAVTVINEHDVAVTSELVMPVRTFDTISIAPAVARVAMATGALAAATGAVAAATGALTAASGSSALSVSISASTAGEALATVRHATAGRTRSAHATGLQPRVANTNEHDPARDPLAGRFSAAELTGAAGVGAMMDDPLAVVLSTSGALFALTPGQPERAAREHRRTRRGKQRRSRSMMVPVQARLFDRR
ncbi:MAG: hypothetical protein ABI467_24455 [Kofleriaceae bacterium]